MTVQINVAYFNFYQHFRGDNPPWLANFDKPLISLVIRGVSVLVHESCLPSVEVAVASQRPRNWRGIGTSSLMNIPKGMSDASSHFVVRTRRRLSSHTRYEAVSNGVQPWCSLSSRISLSASEVLSGGRFPIYWLAALNKRICLNQRNSSGSSSMERYVISNLVRFGGRRTSQTAWCSHLVEWRWVENSSFSSLAGQKMYCTLSSSKPAKAR